MPTQEAAPKSGTRMPRHQLPFSLRGALPSTNQRGGIPVPATTEFLFSYGMLRLVMRRSRPLRPGALSSLAFDFEVVIFPGFKTAIHLHDWIAAAGELEGGFRGQMADV